MSAAPKQTLVDSVAKAIRNADNGINGDPISALLDESPLIDMNTTTRNAADEQIALVCQSAAQAALDACHAEEMRKALEMLLEAKDMKETYGDCYAYRAAKELAWARARAVVAKIGGQP